MLLVGHFKVCCSFHIVSWSRYCWNESSDGISPVEKYHVSYPLAFVISFTIPEPFNSAVHVLVLTLPKIQAAHFFSENVVAYIFISLVTKLTWKDTWCPGYLCVYALIHDYVLLMRHMMLTFEHINVSVSGRFVKLFDGSGLKNCLWEVVEHHIVNFFLNRLERLNKILD